MTDATYKAKLDIADIKTKAAEIERTLTEAFKQAGQKGSADSGVLKVLQEQAKAATEVQRQQTALARAIQESENGATATTKAAAQERVQAAKAESQERIQAAKASSVAQIEEEKRVTAQVKAELQAQAQATKQKAATSGSKSGGIGGALVGAAAGYFTVQGARYIAQQATEFANLGTQVRRTEAAFTILSGGAQKAAANIDAIKTAGGGAIDNLKAMELANQSLALNLAKTPQEFGNIVRAGREVALVSPVIHDVESAISELGLAASNLSYRRLDQLGLTATEVKAKMKELQSANSGLDDSAAFLAASLELLDKKYGTILSSAEAAASGTEKLQVAFSDLYNTLAAGPLGQAIDEGLGDIGNLVAQLAGSLTKVDAALGALEDRRQRIEAEKNGGIGAYLAGNETGDAKQIKAQQDALLAAKNAVKKATLDNVPEASTYKEILDSTSDAIMRNGEANEFELLGLLRIVTGLDKATRAYEEYKKRIDADPEQRRIDAQGQTSKAEDKVSENLKPVRELAENLKTIGVDNFFQKIQDGLSNSAELTATATNKLAEYRQQLVDIAQAVGDQKGIATPAQSGQVDAINAQIDGLIQANKLYQELKKSQTDAAGNDVTRAFDQINRVLAEAKSGVDGFYAGVAGGAQEATDKVNYLAQAIAESGSVTPGQQGILDTLVSQADTSALDQITQTLQELNSGAFDAVPGIDAVTSSLDGMYNTLASGGALTDEQATQLANLSGGADSAGGSMDALSGVVNALGFEFLSSNTYAQELVNQIINLAIAQGSGAITGEQFAGSMSVLTAEILRTANAAGIATPQLIAMLNALNAVNAASGGAAPGQVGGGIYTGQGPAPGLSPSFVRGQQIAEAAAARARLQAETSDRNQARQDAAKAAKAAEAASKKGANDAQREFEKAASAAGKAFENVAKDLEGQLRKVDGLFSASKVTQEDLDAAKTGNYKQKADEYLRQFRDLANNGVKRDGINPQDVKDALGRVGIKASDDLKELAKQFEAAWNDSSLFADKANLKFINKDAVDVTIGLQAKIKQGQQNILEYFGATADAVKEKFKAGDPATVSAVAAELGDSNDKNIRELGESLKTGGQKMIDKVLELAQASIDKSVAGLDLGDGVSFGGGGGGGGVGGGKLQGIVDSAKERVAAKTSDFLSGVNLTGENANLSGAFKITSFDISGTSPLSGAFKITSFDTTALPTIAPVEVKAKIVMDEGGASTASFTDALAKNFENPATRAILAGIGSKASSALVYGFASLAVYGDLVTSFTNEIDTQFKSATTEGVASATGAALAGFIDRGFEGHTPVVAGYVNSVATSFGNSANKAIEAKIGLDIAAEIEKGISVLYVGTDYTSNFILHMQEVFGNESNIGNYQAIGDLIVEQIEGQIGKADLVTTLQSKISAAFAPKRTVVAPGAFLETSAFDFTGMAESATQGLSTAFGTQTSFYEAMGDTAAVYIGYGFGDHDFSGAANNAISQLNSGFMNEANVTQLVTIGNSLADNIHDGFTGRIQSQDWLGTIISAIVASVMNGLADSLKGTK